MLYFRTFSVITEDEEKFVLQWNTALVYDALLVYLASGKRNIDLMCSNWVVLTPKTVMQLPQLRIDETYHLLGLGIGQSFDPWMQQRLIDE